MKKFLKNLIVPLLWGLGISLLLFSVIGGIFGINIFSLSATIGSFIISSLIACLILKDIRLH